MDNKCPKCGKKLSLFYIKQECPECGCDLVYYDMENRLQKDGEKAEAEYAKLDEILAKIESKFNKLLKVITKAFVKTK